MNTFLNSPTSVSLYASRQKLVQCTLNAAHQTLKSISYWCPQWRGWTDHSTYPSLPQIYDCSKGLRKDPTQGTPELCSGNIPHLFSHWGGCSNPPKHVILWGRKRTNYNYCKGGTCKTNKNDSVKAVYQLGVQPVLTIVSGWDHWEENSL